MSIRGSGWGRKGLSNVDGAAPTSTLQVGHHLETFGSRHRACSYEIMYLVETSLHLGSIKISNNGAYWTKLLAHRRSNVLFDTTYGEKRLACPCWRPQK